MRWLVAVLFSFALQASAQQRVWKPKPATPAMARELFTWFDRLGYTRLLKGRIFRLERWTSTNGEAEKLEGFWYGIEQGHGRYLSFSLNGTSGFDKAVLAKPTDAMATELGKPDPSADLKRWGMSAERKSVEAVEPIVWARVAAMYGKEDLALQFLNRALVLNWGESLLGFMKAEMSQREFKEAVYTLLKPGTLWPELRKSLSRVAARFPDQPTAPLANHLMREVDKTIDLNRRVAKDPVGRLIDGLVTEPSWNYLDWTGTATGAADKLADQGFKAVPQLIAALDDPRLTHTLFGWDDWRMEPERQVQQVGSRVVEILERISGQRFRPQFDDVPNIAMAKPKILAWWATVKDRREVDVLTERFLKSDYYAAQDLAKRYPDTFPDVLRAYLKKGVEIGSGFRDLLGLVHTPKAAKLAEELIEKEKDPDWRLSWAQTFANTAPLAASRVMLAKWHAYPEGHEDPYGIGPRMVSLGRAEAVEAVAHDLRRLPFQDRIYIVQSLTDGLAVGSDEAPLRLDRKGPVFAAYERSVERLLVSELSDTAWGFEEGLYDSSQDKLALRICDMAALALSKCFPKKYKYSASQSLATRNALCRRMGGNFPSGPHGSLIVSLVQVRQGDLPAEAVAMARSWVGKRLTAQLVFPLFDFLTKIDSTCPGFYFTVVRDKSGSGFQVNLEVARQITGFTVTSWNTRESGDLGSGKAPLFKVGWGAKKIDFQRDRWTAFLHKVETASARDAVQIVFSALH